MTTLIASLILAAFIFGVAVMLLGYPSDRRFCDALLFALKHAARFAWELQDGVDAGLRQFRATAAQIQVPDLLRPPSRPATAAVVANPIAANSLEVQ